MTNEQSKALRLADALDAVNTNNADSLLVQMAARSAAAELRRLHAENSDYGATIDYLTRENAGQIGEIVALKAQRDALLKAIMKRIAVAEEATVCNVKWVARHCRSAISKAGGAA